VAESGLPGYESSQWYGVLAPAGTPVEILDFLNSQVEKIMRDSAMKSRMTGDGLVPIGSSRQQFLTHIKTEIEKWARVIRASGAEVD
jgi:tripartite-type tricarboxylate transporter receptor subunit TctC